VSQTSLKELIKKPQCQAVRATVIEEIVELERSRAKAPRIVFETCSRGSKTARQPSLLAVFSSPLGLT